jgi:hypothetical protein
MTVGDVAAVVNQPNSRGNMPIGEKVDIKAELDSIFGEELSEEFRTKASSIFEAAVIARVNSEMESIMEKLEEQQNSEIESLKESLIEKVDSYLSYVVDHWMVENKLVVERGLKTEIAEDFMTGLHKLFTESYIDVPEEKLDVMNTMQEKVVDMDQKLNDTIAENIELKKNLSEMKKGTILEELTAGMVETEKEKMKKLVEGVSFDSDSLYREKIKVIKETYFPKAPKTSPEDYLLSESNFTTTLDGSMQQYIRALSKLK